MNHKGRNLGAFIAGLGFLGQITSAPARDIPHHHTNIGNIGFFEPKQDKPEVTPYGIRRNVKELVPMPLAPREARRNQIAGAVADHEIWFGEQDAFKIEVLRIYTDCAGNWVGNDPGPVDLEISAWKTAMVNGKLVWQLVVDPKTGIQDDAATLNAIRDLKTRIDEGSKNNLNAPTPLLRVLYGEITVDWVILGQGAIPTFVVEALDWSTTNGKPYLKAFSEFLGQTIKLGNHLLPQLGQAINLPLSSMVIAAARNRARQYT